jgi:hypothetical protein
MTMPCGAPTTDDESCEQPEGWGRDADEGPCRYHHDDETSATSETQREARESTEGDESTGRSDTFNDVAERRILAALRKGATMEMAAKAAGISRATLHRWRDRHEGFDRKVQRARAEAGLDSLDVIESAADEGDWRAAAWMLEKRYPDQYGESGDLPQEEIESFVETVRTTIRETFDGCETADELLAEIGSALEEATDG